MTGCLKSACLKSSEFLGFFCLNQLRKSNRICEKSATKNRNGNLQISSGVRDV